MSKKYPIITNINDIMQELMEEIRNRKITSNNDFEKTQHAKLVFTTKAWIKIMGLVCTFATEVQWHGLVERQSDDVWKVTDIVTFPHQAYCAAVISEQKEYEDWISSLDDETFSKVKLHGHSHVNMGVYPSGFYGEIIDGNTDESYRARIVSSLPDTNEDSNYYIFVIFNKKQEISARIYDKKKKIIYDTSCNTIDFEIEGVDLFTFINQTKEMCY